MREWFEEVWPVPVEQLQQFMVGLYAKGLAPGSILGMLSALAYQAKMKGVVDNTGDFHIRKMIEGWKRERSHHQNDRAPITPDILICLGQEWDKICRDRHEALLFQAASLIAFWRISRE